MALRPQIWREKNRLDLLGGVFNEPCPATNLSLGTSLNYRYRPDYCQAPILLFLLRMHFVGSVFAHASTPSSLKRMRTVDRRQEAETRAGFDSQPICSFIVVRSSS